MLRIDDISYSIQGRPLSKGATATILKGHWVHPNHTTNPVS